MDPLVPNKKFEPGIYQGVPGAPKQVSIPKPPRLIRTMKLDMEEAIKEQHETSVSIAIAEEKKQAEALRKESLLKSQGSSSKSAPAPQRLGRFVVVFIVILILVALGLAYVFVLPKLSALHIELPTISLPSFSFGGNSSTTPTSTVPETTVAISPSLIPAQSEKGISIGNKTVSQVIGEIQSDLENNLSSGSVRNLLVTNATTGTISITELLSFVHANTPDVLTRSLENKFMVGEIGDQDGNANLFLALKVSDYHAGLAGMLEGEQNLLTILGTLSGKTIASSAKFQDVVVSGKDARMFASAGLNLIYSFADQNTIIITNNQSSLASLLALAVKK